MTEPTPQRYQPLGVIGRGGMATVHRTRDAKAEMEVALKVLHAHLADDEAIVEALEREASIMQSVDHPGVARVYGVTEVDGCPAIAMELCEGGDLSDRLVERSRLDEDEALDIAVAILEALAACHARGIIHRDIKPQNVLFGEDDRPTLIDFGIGQAEEVMAADQAGQLGTVEYIAPERIDGMAVDARSDLYSVGVVLFEILCGHVPYRHESASAVMRMHREAPVADPHLFAAHLSERTRKVVMRAMAKHPEERFDDAEAMIAALRGEARPPERLPDHPDWGALMERYRGDDKMRAPIEQTGREWVVLLPRRQKGAVQSGRAPLIEAIGEVLQTYPQSYTGALGPSVEDADITPTDVFDRFGLARGLSREGVDRLLEELGPAGSIARYARRGRRHRDISAWRERLTRRPVAHLGLTVLFSGALVTATVTLASPGGAASYLYIGALATAGILLGVFAHWTFLDEWWRIHVSNTFILDFCREHQEVETRIGIGRADLERLDRLDSPRVAASYERALNMALYLDDLIENGDGRRRLEELVDDVRGLADQIIELQDEVAAIRPGRLASQIRRLDRQIAAEEDADRAASLIDRKDDLRRQLTDRDEAQQRLQADAQRLHALSSQLADLVRRHRDSEGEDEPVTFDFASLEAEAQVAAKQAPQRARQPHPS